MFVPQKLGSLLTVDNNSTSLKFCCYDLTVVVCSAWISDSEGMQMLFVAGQQTLIALLA